MLNENIKAIRKSKGLSQQELAVKLNVVRQTVSKWEQGISVPDSDMLISISEVFETPVSTLLGENVIETEADTLKSISEKLEVINLQLAQRKTTRRKIIHWLLISLCAIIVMVFAIVLTLESAYLGWNYSDPATAVLGVAFHSFEWLFVRVAPIIFIGTVIGIFLTKKFSEAMNELDNKNVNEAINHKKKSRKPVGVKWGVAAACFFAVFLAGIFALRTDDIPLVSIGGIERDYKDVYVVESEPAIEWPWEYKTIVEQYTTINLNDKEYYSSGRPVDASFIGELIGTFDVMGYDAHSNQNHKIASEIYRIDGISEEYVVSVKLDGEFYVFSHNEYAPPVNLGEVLDNYALEQTLLLDQFTKYDGYEQDGHFKLSNDSYIWDVLNACRDAEFVQDDNWGESNRSYLSFTATSDSLGIYKRVFNVTKDGYIWTNIFDYAYIFRIGQEAADQIISHAVENGTESEMEPYNASLVGKLTEIADEYILVDDTVLCSDENDGMTFKVYLNDLRISRCIDFGEISVGDIVVVYFTGDIDTDAGNVVEGAFSLSKGTISDGGVSVPE